jgi:hypothetical protein
MFFGKQQFRVIERNRLWYVETQTGYEGPFKTSMEAKQYKRLRERVDMARVEFAGFEDSLTNT